MKKLKEGGKEIPTNKAVFILIVLIILSLLVSLFVTYMSVTSASGSSKDTGLINVQVKPQGNTDGIIRVEVKGENTT